jgi:hypothetical protein
MKSINRRWYRRDKEEALRTVAAQRRTIKTLLICLVAVAFISPLVYCNIIGPRLQKESYKKIIYRMILEKKSDFDPLYAKAAADYLVDNAEPFNALWLANKAWAESGFNGDAKSSAGAESYFQILPHGGEKQIPPEQRGWWAYQLGTAKRRISGFYEKPMPTQCRAFNKVHAMHLSYVGCKTKAKEAEINAYLVRLYTGYAESADLIWASPSHEWWGKLYSKVIGKKKNE